MGDPIRREFLFDDRLAPFGEPDMMVDYVYHSGDLNNGLLRESGDQSADEEEEEQPEALKTLVQDYNLQATADQEALSEDEILDCKSEDNIAYKNRTGKKDKLTVLQWLKWLTYDNSFMRRLFPEIKQQKPGHDLYVFVATIQIILIAYVFLFYSQMQGNESDIATQFTSNQYSSKMVLLLIVMICIMVVDRVLYSTHAFLSGQTTTYD